MAKWIEYTGSDEQIIKLSSAKYGLYLKFEHSDKMFFYNLRDISTTNGTVTLSNTVTHYLICEPHPYADIIKIWADTGCEVWVRYEWRDSTGPHSETYVTDEPDWNIPGAEYSLTPFEK